MRLLTVSRLDAQDAYKQIDLLISVVHELEMVSLLIIGKGSDLDRLIGLRGTCSRISFFGAVPDPGYFMQHTDCFVLPSTKEGFGLVFLEAMLHSKPCIGWDSGATSEVISNEVTGLLVSSRKELAEAIIWMVTHKTEREMFGRNGLIRAQHAFSRQVFTNRLKELLG